MSKIKSGAHPHIHSGNSTHSYMFDLPITTYPMAVVAVIIQFFYAYIVLETTATQAVIVAFNAALVIAVAVSAALLAESLWWRFVDKKYDDFAGWFRIMATTYPSITGMLYALSIPIDTPLWVAAIGAFAAIIIGKTIFGGVGHNIFNPALVGRAFITVAFTSTLTYQVTKFIPGVELPDGISSATPLTHIASHGQLLSYDQIVEAYGSFWNLFLGLYPGSLGETLSFYIILCFIFLAFRKTIKWYMPVIYIALVFGMTWGVGYLNDLQVGSPTGLGLYFPLFHILTGSVLFGAVFFATEPVTSPMTRHGQIIYVTYIAIINVAIRILGNYPEGVLFSILFMNMFVPIIDNATMGQTQYTFKAFAKRATFWLFTGALIVGLVFYMANQVGGVA